MILPLYLSLLLHITFAKKYNLFNPSLDHYGNAIQLINKDNWNQGIEVGRAACRHNPNHRDSIVNLGGFYLNLWNKKDFPKPISHVQALELFSIMNYAMTKWPSFHGTIHNMESTLRWLCSSSPTEVRDSMNLIYDTTLNGQEGWNNPVSESLGDRKIAYEYGLKHAPSFVNAVAHRGPRFMRNNRYQDFERDAEKENKRILKLQEMARVKRSDILRKQKKKTEL